MKKILVIFGGRSTEHDVSILTGNVIIKALNATQKYEVYPLYISKEGQWYSHSRLADLNLYKNDSSLRSFLVSIKPINISFEDGLTLIWPGFRIKKLKIDVAFPAMHGTYGEDGSLMGLLKMSRVAYAGCDMAASVVAMDKVLTKQVTQSCGIPSTPYVWFMANDWQDNEERHMSEINRLKMPLFIKPVHLGSSIGISRIDKDDDIKNAIEVAMHYDNKIIIESAVAHLIEVTCLALGNDDIITSLVEEPLHNSNFLDFDNKYITKGGSIAKGSQETTIIPARISEALTKQVQVLTKKAFKAIGGVGIARCDFLINGKTNEIYLNEINTLPGTLYIHNWKKSGISPAQLVDKLIILALERQTEDEKISYVFESSMLSQMSGSKLSSVGDTHA